MSFSVWDERVHNSPAAYKSFEKAVKMDTDNILRIDFENLSGAFFAGVGTDDYNTTLSHCDCQDFKYNKKGQAPCKHIYRLAIELGLIDPTTEPWVTYLGYSKLYNTVMRDVKKLNIYDLQKLDNQLDEIFAETDYTYDD